MPTNSPSKLGLSLSGGGYRASAFHLGTLKKLQQLKLLEKIWVISTISGGSITGAAYSLNKASFEIFYKQFYDSLLNKNVIKALLLSQIGFRFLLFFLLLLGSGYFLFTPYAWLFPCLLTVLIVVLFKFQFWLFPISKEIERIYDCYFYKGATLKDLNEKPVLVIGSTNLQTARPFTFSKHKMQDTTYTFMQPPVLFDGKDFPLARAVMASSCVPFAFTPIKIDPQFFKPKEFANRVHPVLVDGGLYDNQGIHKLMQKGSYACEYVITSDAGTGKSGEKKFRNTIGLLLETVEVFMARIKKQQMEDDVYEHNTTTGKEIAYISLGWDPEKLIPGFVRNMIQKQVPESVIKAHEIPAEWESDPDKFQQEISKYMEHRIGYDQMSIPTEETRHIARSVGTNLTSLPEVKLNSLIAMAETLTEIQVKLYCPSIFNL